MASDANLSISLQTGGSKAQIKALKDEIKGLNAEYKATAAELKENSTETERLTAKQKLLAAQLEKQQAITKINQDSWQKNFEKQETYLKKLDTLQKALSEAKASKDEEAINQNTEAIARQQKAYNNLLKDMERYADAVKASEIAERLLSAELKSVNAELKTHAGVLQAADEQMKRFAEGYSKGTHSVSELTSTLKTVGTGLTVGVTAPIVAVGTAAAKSAIDFESAFAGVEKTVDGTAEQLEELRQGIRDMAKEMPASATSIAEVAEAAGQLGIKTENILEFSRTMSDLGVSTNLSATDAATSLARFANITKMSQEDFSRLGSTIVDLGNNFATTESEIVEMGLRLAGAGNQIGLSNDQILGMAAALSSLGLEAEAGGTAFSRTMITMQLAVEQGAGEALRVVQATGVGLEELSRIAETDTVRFESFSKQLGISSGQLKKYLKEVESLNDFAKVSGMSAAQFVQAFQVDAAGAITAFVTGLSKMNEEGISAVKTLDELGLNEIRVRDALLRASNAHELFSDAMDVSNKAWQENNALTEEASKRYQTTESQLQIMKNQLTDAAIQLGSAFLPIIKEVAKQVGAFAESFGSMDESTRDTIITLGLLAAALGPVVGTVGKAIEIVSGLKTAFAMMSVQATLAGTTTAAAGTAATGASAGFATLTMSMGPVGAAVAGLTVLTVAGVAAWHSYKTAQEEAEKAILQTGETLEKAGKQYEEVTAKTKNIDQLVLQWEKLKAKVDENRGSVEELAQAKADLAGIEQQLIDNSDGLISKYDAENGRIRDHIELLKQHNEIKGKLAKADLQVQVDKTNIAELQERNNRYKTEIDALAEQAVKLAEARLVVSEIRQEFNQMSFDAESTTESLEKLTSVRKEIGLYGISNLSLAGVDGPTKLTLDEIDKEFDLVSEKLAQTEDNLRSVSSGIEEFYQKSKMLIELDMGSTFEDSVEKLALLNKALSESQSKTGIAANTMQKLSAIDSKLAQEISNAADKTGLFTQKQKEAETHAASFIEQMKALALEVGEMPDGKTIDIDILVKDITEDINKNIEAENNLTESILDTVAAGEQAIQKAQEEQEARESLSIAFDNAVGSMNKLESAYRTLNNGQALSVEQLIELIEKYPQISEYMAEYGDITLQNGEIIKQVAELERAALLEKMELRAQDLTNEVEMAEKRVEAVRREYADKVKLFQVYSGIASMAPDSSKEDAALEDLRMKQAEYAKILAQINAVKNTVNNTGWFSGSRPQSSGGGGSSTAKADEGKAQKEAEKAQKEMEKAQREAEKAEEEARQQSLNEWSSYWKEREEGSKKWIDKQKFYNQLSFQEEVEAYDRVLMYMQEAKAKATELTYATEEEKLNIIKDFADKIESYERLKYSAEKRLKEESIQDRQYDDSQQEKSLQKAIDQAKSTEQKLQAYTRLRTELQKTVTANLSAIDEKYWLTEKERLREAESVYEAHSKKMGDIDRQMYALRKERLDEYAEQWHTNQKKALAEAYESKKGSLDKELEAVRSYYDALDAEERRSDRNDELGDLYEQASIYQNAATKEGQDKYKNIVNQIERLQKEANREARQEERAAKEMEITGKLTDLDSVYSEQQDELEQTYELLKQANVSLAEFTSAGMKTAAESVTVGLEGIFGSYGEGLERFQNDTLMKVRKLASDIAKILEGIDLQFGTAAGLNGVSQSNVATNSKNASVVFNDYGNKNFHSPGDSEAYWAEASNITLYALAQRV